jgi:hypothetical protein
MLRYSRRESKKEKKIQYTVLYSTKLTLFSHIMYKLVSNVYLLKMFIAVFRIRIRIHWLLDSDPTKE